MIYKPSLVVVTAGFPGKRSVVSYECCPEQYIDVTFSLHIRRRTLFYVINLVVPCMTMSFLSVLVFSMAPETGEKVTFGLYHYLLQNVFITVVTVTIIS